MERAPPSGGRRGTVLGAGWARFRPPAGVAGGAGLNRAWGCRWRGVAGGAGSQGGGCPGRTTARAGGYPEVPGLEVRLSGGDVVVLAPEPLGRGRARHDVRNAGGVSDPPLDVAAHVLRQRGHRGLGGRPLRPHGVDDRRASRVARQLVLRPGGGALRRGVTRLDIQRRGLGVAAVGVDPQHLLAVHLRRGDGVAAGGVGGDLVVRGDRRRGHRVVDQVRRPLRRRRTRSGPVTRRGLVSRRGGPHWLTIVANRRHMARRGSRSCSGVVANGSSRGRGGCESCGTGTNTGQRCDGAGECQLLPTATKSVGQTGSAGHGGRPSCRYLPTGGRGAYRVRPAGGGPTESRSVTGASTLREPSRFPNETQFTTRG